MTAMPKAAEAILGATAMHWGLLPDRTPASSDGDAADASRTEGALKGALTREADRTLADA
jgi:hypothetical protein